MRSWIPVLVWTLLTAPPAYAAKLGGVRVPDQVKVAGQQLVLNGLGLREATFLKVDVYVAALYLPEKTSDAKQILKSTGPKRMVQHFVRDVDREDMADKTRKGFERNAPRLVPKVKKRMERMLTMLPDVKKGDRVVLTHVSGKVELELNGKKVGSIEGDDFAQALFSAWLGPKPPNSGLKRGLLGK